MNVNRASFHQLRRTQGHGTSDRVSFYGNELEIWLPETAGYMLSAMEGTAKKTIGFWIQAHSEQLVNAPNYNSYPVVHYG